MKKTTISIVLAALCLKITICSAQSIPITPLKIGDTVPEMRFDNVLKYKSSSSNFSDFKGKLLILDFWGTWCAPCVAMIPKMDSLQQVFGNKIQFLSVTDEASGAVESFMGKLEQQKHRNFNLPIVTEDNKLARLFPHTFLPHYVWIDGEGVVQAVTEFKEINESNIRKILDGDMLNVRVKQDPANVPYDYKRPLLANNNGGKGESLYYHSLLTKYIEGIGMGAAILPDSINMRIVGRNQPIEWLFRLAYSEHGSDFFSEASTVLEVANKDLLNTNKIGQECLDWCRGNAFCYEILVPRAMKQLNAFKLMQEDLRRFFPQYIGSVESRKTWCLILRRTSNRDKIHSTSDKTNISFDRFGWNVNKADLNLIIERLNGMQSYPIKIINDTGYKGLVDISISANLPDLTAVNRELEKYDLKFVEGDHESRVLVIRDSPRTQ